MRQVIGLISSALTALILTGCGGGSGGTVDPATGISTATFIDSPVSGLEFESSTQSGITDTKGNYIYKEGESITFHIGNLYLGTAKPKNGVITPLDLIGTTDVNDPKVINILQVLQTLDSDNNASNGITIDTAVRETLENQTEIHLDKETDDAKIQEAIGQNYEVTEDDAKTHFEDHKDDESNGAEGYTPPSTVLAPPAPVSLPTTYKADAGRLLGSQCAQCHGTNGISVNEWDSIAGEDNLPDEIYQDDEPIMNAQAHGYTKEEIILIGNWLKTLQKNN